MVKVVFTRHLGSEENGTYNINTCVRVCACCLHRTRIQLTCESLNVFLQFPAIHTSAATVWNPWLVPPFVLYLFTWLRMLCSNPCLGRENLKESSKMVIPPLQSYIRVYIDLKFSVWDLDICLQNACQRYHSRMHSWVIFLVGLKWTFHRECG